MEQQHPQRRDTRLTFSRQQWDTEEDSKTLVDARSFVGSGCGNRFVLSSATVGRCCLSNLDKRLCMGGGGDSVAGQQEDGLLFARIHVERSRAATRLKNEDRSYGLSILHPMLPMCRACSRTARKTSKPRLRFGRVPFPLSRVPISMYSNR